LTRRQKPRGERDRRGLGASKRPKSERKKKRKKKNPLAVSRPLSPNLTPREGGGRDRGFFLDRLASLFISGKKKEGEPQKVKERKSRKTDTVPADSSCARKKKKKKEPLHSF